MCFNNCLKKSVNFSNNLKDTVATQVSHLRFRDATSSTRTTHTTQTTHSTVTRHASLSAPLHATSLSLWFMPERVAPPHRQKGSGWWVVGWKWGRWIVKKASTHGRASGIEAAVKKAAEQRKLSQSGGRRRQQDAKDEGRRRRALGGGWRRKEKDESRVAITVSLAASTASLCSLPSAATRTAHPTSKSEPPHTDPAKI